MEILADKEAQEAKNNKVNTSKLFYLKCPLFIDKNETMSFKNSLHIRYKIGVVSIHHH